MDGAFAAVSVRFRVASTPTESITRTTNEVEPLTGVPEMTPPPESVSPESNAPEEMLQDNEPVPPLAANVCEYDAPGVANGNVDVEITGAAFTNRVRLFESVWLAASITCAVKLNDPDIEGIPARTPELGREIPGGNDPAETDQEYGDVPPLAARATETDCPTVTAASELVVIAGVPVTEIDNALVAAIPTLSVTRTVKALIPTAVGIPEMTPPDDMDNPAGKAPIAIDQVIAPVPPEDVRVDEKGPPSAPSGNEDVVTAGAGFTTMLNASVACAPLQQATFAVNEAVPDEADVPVIAPLLEFNARPVGREPESIVQVLGVVPPLDASVCEYAAPTVVAGRDTVVTSRAA